MRHIAVSRVAVAFVSRDEGRRFAPAGLRRKPLVYFGEGSVFSLTGWGHHEELPRRKVSDVIAT